MRFLSSLSLAILLATSALGDEGHKHTLTAEEVGSVRFTTSCAQPVAADFNRAVALLHSFQYEQARQAFASIAGRDPGCAMAEWGIAMSHYHGMWDSGDPMAGAAALRKAQQVAAANAGTSKREAAYIDALAEIYSSAGDKAARARQFEHKMAALRDAYPDDSEAAIFYALTLAITAPKTDKTFANQRKCGEILEPLFRQQPHHPGIAHYIVHCYDNPVLAEQGLAAARAYASIAPASAHANHMPSHIFTRVGDWDDSIASNTRSAQLAAAAEATSTGGEARDQRLHAMDYLAYAYLQSGRVRQAKAVVEEMNRLNAQPGITHTGGYAEAAIPARFAIETGRWEEASRLQAHPESVAWAQAVTWAAIGVGSARSGRPEQAKQAEKKLAELRDALAAEKDIYWSHQVEVERREVEAWMAMAAASPVEAIAALRSAAELEESMDKNAVTPGPVTPAREMLAEMLLLDKHPGEALAEYETALQSAPNRFNALYGAASAAEAAGNPSAAQRYFRKLTEVAVGEERPELAEARKKIGVTAENRSRSR